MTTFSLSVGAHLIHSRVRDVMENQTTPLRHMTLEQLTAQTDSQSRTPRPETEMPEEGAREEQEQGRVEPMEEGEEVGEQEEEVEEDEVDVDESVEFQGLNR